MKAMMVFLGALAMIFASAQDLEASKESKNEAFYALSSLCFYFQQGAADASDPNAERIKFTKKELANLWEKAMGDAFLFEELQEAKKYHLLALEDEGSVGGEENNKKAQELLAGVWQKRNANYLNQLVDKTKHRGPFFPYTPLAAYPGLFENPYIDEKMKAMVEPFLIALDHPLKEALDDIFTKSRVIKDRKTITNAGFTIHKDQLYSFIIITKHPDLPGVLQKIYLDTEKNKKSSRPGWLSLTRRCMGAANVRALIKEKGLKYFVAPDKCLYLLPMPADKRVAKNETIQPVILLATDMQIVSNAETINVWKNLVTHAQLDELSCIISHGLASSGLVRNIPYTKSGKFACVDTEKPEKTPNYSKVSTICLRKCKSIGINWSPQVVRRIL